MSWPITSTCTSGTVAPASSTTVPRIANRSFEIVYPETGDSRTSAFRLDPSKLPRQIDILSSGDRIMKGIYVIEGDGLAVCLQQNDGEPRPASFDAPAGSGHMLLRMKLARPASPALVPAVLSRRVCQKCGRADEGISENCSKMS